jgi:hypothetical protein
MPVLLEVVGQRGVDIKIITVFNPSFWPFCIAFREISVLVGVDEENDLFQEIRI